MNQTAGTPKSIGIVVIGRNEGERLRRCLQSVLNTADCIVYVDSGSTDNSVEISRSLGVDVLNLDPKIPFTASRARNEGMWHLLRDWPHLYYVFFIDGDSELVAHWLPQACDFLDQNPDVAVISGLTRERHPERSIYNLLCDIEWTTMALGECRTCGGSAVMRVDALRQVNGFRPDLICGEEPELCVRLRQAGWKVWRLNATMTVHDAAIYRFDQWWRRTLRGGFAFAQGADLHGALPERHFVAESRRIWIWGLWLPIGILALLWSAGLWALWLLALYPLNIIRLWLQGERTPRENWWRSCALVLGKFPEMLGQLQFLITKHHRNRSRLIEYK